MANVTEKYLSGKEVAEILGVSAMTVRRQKNNIGYFRIGNRVVFSYERHVLPFLEKVNCPAKSEEEKGNGNQTA